MLRDKTPRVVTGRALQARRLRLWAASPWCAKCGKLLTLDLCEIDHIVARVNGGPDEDGNCQVLCIEHHKQKTERDLGYSERTRFDRDGRVVW